MKTKTDFIRMSFKRKDFENMSDFLVSLRRKGNQDAQKLVDEIIKSGGRSLFDPYCSGWNNSTYQEKLNSLISLLRQGIRLNTLISIYKKMYKGKGRGDIADAVEDALAELLEYNLIKTENAKSGGK